MRKGAEINNGAHRDRREGKVRGVGIGCINNYFCYFPFG